MRNRPVLAVFVAALIPMVVGAIWYAPFLFGRAWERAHGYDDPTRMAALQENVTRNYLVAFVTYLVMALVLRFFLYRLAASDARSALQIATLCWLGFVVTVSLTSILFAQQHLSLWGIDGSFQFIYLNLMALVLRPKAA
ncbi:MAG TPA: DUF1761 domain-containing protein [Gemmatimonadaceae bacterium]|nr:DUF1761 domain-containing protein [Gemmatimonadaceae bacterium]